MEATTAIELDAQYRAMREGAGLLDRSDRGKLLVTGDEAADLLQGQLTNDVEGLAPDQGCYAALLDRKGHVQADMRVLRLEAAKLWLDLEPEATEVVLRHLTMYKVGREVGLEDVSSEWAITSLIGPASAEVAGSGPLSPEHAQRFFEREGIDLLAVATDLGVDLIARTADAEPLHGVLGEAGAVAVSEDAAEILRVESGRPRFGREMTTKTIPQEAGIDERAVSFTKGCYIGQETVARLHYRGKPNRHLRGLRLDRPARAGDPIVLGEREVGTIGTAVISPAEGPIALGVVRREANPGDRVAVGDGITAEVVELPFRRLG